MKTFHVFNYASGSWGFYQNIDLVILAESEDKAIDLAKHHYPDYKKDWKCEHLTDAVNYISSSCS